MPVREPKLPWYQFSLRSLLLFTAIVAVLSSIGVCTDWSVAAVIGVGGIAGGIVARSWMGLALGAVAGGMGAAVAVIAFVFLRFLLFGWPLLWVPSLQFIAAMYIAAIIGSLIGGVLSGRMVRFRSER